MLGPPFTTQFTLYLVFLDEHVAAKVVKQIVHRWLVTSQRVVVIESIDLDLPQVELVAGEHSLRVHVLGEFLG